MRQRNVPPLRSDRGFTLIEVMVAALVLIVGILGTFTLLDGANKTLQENNARVAATNLARELIEQTRSANYDSLTPAAYAGAVRPKVEPGPGGSTTGAWKVQRRGVVYSVSANICTFDDPKDGLLDPATPAADAPPNMCARPAAIAGTGNDANPDDFRRVEVVLSWQRGIRTRTLSQTALVVNPSGSLGPRITSLTRLDQLGAPTTAQVGESWAGPAGTSCPPDSTLSSCPVLRFRATSRSARTLHYYTDDQFGYANDLQRGTACCPDGLTWTLTWPIGTVGTAPFVVDGAYTLTGQAFNGLGIAGEAVVVPALLNRRRPPALTGIAAGRNLRHGGIVDIRWDRATDRDVIQYRVTRVVGTTRTEICPSATAPLATECTDPSPPSGTVSYDIRAYDRTDLANSASLPREGEVVNRAVVGAGVQPPAPAALAVDSDPGSGKPRLTWTQPTLDPGAPAILFYRIYRNGTLLGNRYDRTLTTDPFYGDPNPGTASSHTYTVTAVDTTMNESAIATRASDGTAEPVVWSRT